MQLGKSIHFEFYEINSDWSADCPWPFLDNSRELGRI